MVNSKISVIVPIYNVEKYLERCIESIINQTHKNLEIILVDDGSPDRCPQICDNYALLDHRITVIHKKNGGLSSARNAGISIATGEYIGFVDSDDYIDVHMYEVLLNACLNQDCKLSVCNIQHFTGDRYGDEVKRCDKYKTITNIEALWELQGADGELFCVAWNKLYHKDLFHKLRYPEGKINEDEFVIYKAIYQAGNVAVCESSLYFYFQDNNGSITKNKKYFTYEDVFDAFNEREEYFKKAGYPKLEFATYRSYLDRIIQNYILLKKNKEKEKQYFDILTKRYREKYKVRGNQLPGIGYRVFYVSPNLYLMLKGVHH
ncbi:glycosyltransferase family 2 protein [Anaerosporobacter sp.]